MDDVAIRRAALTRRVRALARTAPLHAMEAHKNSRAMDLRGLDLRLLGLAAIEAVVDVWRSRRRSRWRPDLQGARAGRR